MNISIV